MKTRQSYRRRNRDTEFRRSRLRSRRRLVIEELEDRRVLDAATGVLLADVEAMIDDKLSSSGDHLWSTYLGGASTEIGDSIAVDAAGNILVTGSALSSGWTSGGFDTSHNGAYDGFVAKLSSTGSHVWSTYLGGANYENGQDIAVDATGDILVTGHTASSGWVSGGFDTSFNGVVDAFVAKISSTGGHLWSSYLGGSGRALASQSMPWAIRL